ncbi:MAG: hypothetical protein CFE43_21155 [Burkholderiales bacterium PBB3]|nr:MAG: hypothetical protein CFE43_21155 [Burkholderiales bacterium PBB3]
MPVGHSTGTISGTVAVVLILVALIVGALGAWAIGKGQKVQLSVKILGSSVNLDTDAGGQVAGDRLLETLMNNQDSVVKSGVRSILRTTYGLHDLKDHEIAGHFQQVFCKDSDFPNDMQFEANLKKRSECAEKNGLAELRKLAREFAAPFHQVPIKLEVTLPRDRKDDPPPGKINYCDPEWQGRTVVLSTGGSDPKIVKLLTNNPISACTKGITIGTSGHINLKTSEELFGSTKTLRRQVFVSIL